ncbi:MAG: hypothetical protein ACU837_01620 [Gammaproteobacteria bacterium]
MNKMLRFVFLPVFLTILMSGYVMAAIPGLKGTYKVTGAKYIVSSLPSCQGVAITVKITSQCGRLLKGSIAVGTTTIPVQGRIYTDNTVVYLTGTQLTTGSTVYLMGGYQASPKAIKVLNNTFKFYSPTSFPYADSVFDDFKLAKQ